MAETKWTPGPWEAGGNDVRIISGELLACSYQMAADGDDDYVRASHTAHLIAAAPELYDALFGVMELVSEGRLVRDTKGDHESGWAIKQVPLLLALKSANAALAKARGEAPHA